MTEQLFAPDYRDVPYWWEAAPPPDLPPVGLPARSDVVVVGSGYTGLCAALVMARGGRDVLVVDSEAAGWGCSSRNGGQISTSIKPGFDELVAAYGQDLAFGIRREGLNALDYIGDFVRSESIDCDFERVGRFHAAHNPAQYEKLARLADNQPKGLEVEAHMVPRAEQHREMGSQAYYGGCVYPTHAALDPGRYHAGLLTRVQEAGATLVAHCPVSAIEHDGTGFTLHTAKGKVTASNVVVATNGYTESVTPGLRRRVIPIGSYMIATEPVDPDLMGRLTPNNRVFSDTRKLVFYYRNSPDRRRILFGGRVALKETNPRVSAPRLHAAMTAIWPELKSVRISHSWVGFVAYTFDTLPHLGARDGLHFAMGYCGSGVSLASYFGFRIGQQVLGLAEGKTALDGIAFPTRPLYSGNPWFLAPSILVYKFLDRLNR
jgi:glycine/D-amino acid oxidase-like deaminating enzyme